MENKSSSVHTYILILWEICAQCTCVVLIRIIKVTGRLLACILARGRSTAMEHGGNGRQYWKHPPNKFQNATHKDFTTPFLNGNGRQGVKLHDARIIRSMPLLHLSTITDGQSISKLNGCLNEHSDMRSGLHTYMYMYMILWTILMALECILVHVAIFCLSDFLSPQSICAILNFTPSEA